MVVLLVIGGRLAVQFTKDCEFVSHVSDVFELRVLNRSRGRSKKLSSALIASAAIVLSRSVLGMGAGRRCKLTSTHADVRVIESAVTCS